MNLKPWLVFLIITMTLAMVAETSRANDFNSHGLVGDFIGDDNEMMLNSETNRRTLAGRQRYISYGSLRDNQVPCGQRGRSYYNCQQRGRANPYNRGCSAITHCARNTN